MGVIDATNVVVPPEVVADVAVNAINEIYELLEQHQDKRAEVREEINADIKRAMRRAMRTP